MRIFLIVISGVFIGLVSCSVQKNYAKKWIRNSDTIHILVLNTERVSKNCSDYRRLDSSNDMHQALITEDCFMIGEINDSDFCKSYYNQLISSLKQYPIVRVYGEGQIGDFFNKNNKSFIFNLAQVEIEEFLSLYEDDAQFDTLVYYQCFNLNNLGLYSWFEVTEPNQTERAMTIVYSDYIIKDKIDGGFRYNIFTTDVDYVHSKKRISVQDIEKVSVMSAQQNASYIFDYVMNQCIAQDLYGRKIKMKYLSYKLGKKKISKAYTQRFVNLSTDL
ncbi:MAG: hypothetical protein GX587_04445 [Bacteroidales bacterium]|nr:hypothetical protein [Bacteroidales bacterium]